MSNVYQPLLATDFKQGSKIDGREGAKGKRVGDPQTVPIYGFYWVPNSLQQYNETTFPTTFVLEIVSIYQKL